MRKLFLLTLLWGFSLSAFATHNRAGEITFRHVSALTYEFTVTVFADGRSRAIDRKELEIFWGDGLGSDSLNVILEEEIVPGSPIFLKRVWRGKHTFPASGTYTISVSDPNRNKGVDNINNSDQVPFYLETVLRVSPLASFTNNSPQLLNYPLDDACVGQPFVHNPGAYDPDGDSLAYRIDSSRSIGGVAAPGFYFPDNMSVDPVTGDLSWTNPTRPGIINVAIRILEYRGEVLLSETLRDIQIEVFEDCNNRPPYIISKQEYCVEAGKTLVAKIQALDLDNNQKVTLSATGSPFEVSNNKADFNNSSASNPTYASIVWNTLCEHVKISNYTASIRAEDNGGSNGSINLTSYEVIKIKVIAPAPQNFTAVPKRTNIELNWDNGNCAEAVGYSIYRRLDSSGFVPDSCTTGVPEGIGYEKIATINNVNNTTFIDDNEGEGLVPGRKYCYLIHSFFSDGAKSYASAEVCAKVQKVSPVLTKVSIDSTDENNGIIQLAWSPPDSINPVDFPPPYRYLLYQKENGTYSLIDSTLSLVDTTYELQSQNTFNLQHSFFVELWSYGSSRARVSQAVKSSSVFLNLETSDRQIQLSWNSDVAWREDSFIIHRRAPNENNYTALDTITEQNYLDTGLINEEDYCYFIESRGSYNLNSVNLPLINFSQKVCDHPTDDVPPCPPIFEIESNCEEDDLKIIWEKGKESCEEDLQAYQIYYSPTLDGELELIAELSGSTYEFNPELAKNSGCYSVVAVDTVGNLSEVPEKICRDYCPYFELPNIFTPNGDGVNDLFEPIPPNNNPGTPNFRDVDSIDLKIYNRWQQLVFETHKPEVKWNGFHQKEEKMLKDGVYYYHCVVYERSLSGVKPRIIQGTVTLRDGDKNFNGTYK